MTETPNWPDQRGSAVLSPTDCQRLLEQVSGGFGRLGLVIDGRPVVLPFNYVLLGGDVLLRLGPGATLDALLNEPTVAFEVDHEDEPGTAEPEAWSVLVQGSAQVVRDHLALERARASGLTPLVEGMGSVFVLVRDGALTGRRFGVGALARFGSHGKKSES